MINIDGIELTESYIPRFQWVRDIQYFEGTLTAEYSTENGDLYVFHWCECNNSLNRWLAVRTNRRSLYLMTSGLVSMRDFFENHILDSNVLILDITSNSVLFSAKLTHLSSVANEYLPEQNEYIESELIPGNSSLKEYPVLIDKQWTAEQLAMFPRKFMDAYALVTEFVKDKASNPTCNWANLRQFTNSPWLGGGSSSTFYSDLRNKIGRYVGIDAIQYASPGYIKFHADREIGLLVKKNLEQYLLNKVSVDAEFSALLIYLRDNDLNKDNAVITTIHNQFLEVHGQRLMQHFSEPTWDWVLNGSPDVFRAVKVSMSYYRRIKPMSEFVENEMVKFGNL